MRVAVTGGRTWDIDSRYVWSVLDAIDAECRIDILLAGDASGVDELAHRWAMQRNKLHSTFRAEWKKFGRRAGPIRNREMLVQGKPDLLIAFAGGRGTANCVATAIQLDIEVRKFTGGK